MARLVVILVAAAALLGVAAPAGAQHGVFFFCNVEPFTYHVQGSSYVPHNGRYEYAASGTTLLTGPDCPVHGQRITIHESGVVFGLFPFTTVAAGSWNARIDRNQDGVTDVTANGQVTLFGPGNPYLQLAGAGGPIMEMGLVQLAEIDLTNPHHHPLISLETIEGGISGFIGHHP